MVARPHGGQIRHWHRDGLATNEARSFILHKAELKSFDALNLTLIHI